MCITMTSNSFYNTMNLMKLLLLITSLLFTIAKSEIIVVGGDDSNNRWSDGFNYVSWAQSLNFKVGDVLVFSYTPGAHNVLDVTRATFQSCDNSTGVNAIYTSGNDHVELEQAKQYWFICTVANHCQLGMRFGINVSAAATDLNQTSNSTLNNPSFASNAGVNLLAVGILSMLVIIV